MSEFSFWTSGLVPDSGDLKTHIFGTKRVADFKGLERCSLEDLRGARALSM